MFEGIRNFLYRHRRKFLIGGGIVGSIVLLSRYAEYKIFEWHDKQTSALIEKQKRRHHYEKTRQTANATALNLSSSITKIVSDELGIDKILQALHSQPLNKLKLWEELKVQGFSRCISTIYTSALVGSIIHTKLMVLGGYTYNDTVKIEKSDVKITAVDQEKYLSHLQNFIEKGLPLLINKVRQATDRRVRSLALNHSLSLEKLEGIFRDIVLSLNGENTSYTNDKSFKLQPWSSYITEQNIKCHSKSTEEIAFYRMTEEMIDVIDSEDFNIVIQNLVHHGINHILDYVADFYPQPSLNTIFDHSTLKICTEHSSSSQEKICNKKKESTNDTSNLEIGFKPPLKYDTHPAPINLKLMPVAKLTPILSDLVRPCLSPAPGHLLQFVLLNEMLENLSFNIYEAFSRSN
ncbi:UNVERIFIED_CONTAM: hypothetical protein GTU68_057745 [Idotea baltica]|nr:hypothetical protein [Idotea baltica]